MKEIKISGRLLEQLRKLLHKHPELSQHEGETAKRISGFLKSHKPHKIIEGIGGTGLAAVYQYYSDSPTVMIRCELDALPIQEINDFKHKSVVDGVSHKCGHDGHMTIVAGLAKQLAKKAPRRGRVVLLFQPAEENGMGAKSVIEDPKFKDIEPDYVFALHNLPGYKKHKILCRPGSFTPTVNSMNITLTGKTSHAAEPEMGINPAMAIAEIIAETRKLERPANQDDFALVTPIQITMGEEAYGISAGEGVVRLTLRCWAPNVHKKLCKDTEKIVSKVAKKHNIKADIEYIQEFESNQNNPAMVDVVKTAAELNKLEYQNPEYPFRWGEDFGLFTSKYKGAMFGLGAGEDTPALHNPDYDYPDDITPTGVKMFKSIIDELLN